MDALPSEGLPPGWGTATLETICDINPATDISALSSETAITFVPMAAVGALTNTVDTSTTRPLREITTGFTRFQSGDVIFAKITPCMENGKVALVPELPHGIGIGSTEFHVARPKPGIDAAFVCHYLMQESFRATARRSMSGAVGQQRVPAAFLREALIPVAPTAEQTRIVAAVNALFEEVEAGEAALARAREGLTQFRASLLHAAYSGELTADWRAAYTPNEGGFDLVASIVAARRAAGWTGTIPEVSASSPLPANWAWSSLGELFDVFVGATPPRGNPDFWGGDIPWVSSGEVAFCRIQRTRETITAAGLASSSTRLHPPGTLLLAMIGEGRTRGQAAILDIAACNNQNSAAIRVSDTSIPMRFVYHWLTFVYEETRRAGAGGNQPALNKERVRAIALPVPPLAEMEEIVRRVDALIADSMLHDVSDEASRLRQSILHAAFTGRLVPQDPAEEPAGALLARLRATPTAANRARARRIVTQPGRTETPA